MTARALRLGRLAPSRLGSGELHAAVASRGRDGVRASPWSSRKRTMTTADLSQHKNSLAMKLVPRPPPRLLVRTPADASCAGPQTHQYIEVPSSYRLVTLASLLRMKVVAAVKK
jgi:hypothetical protein